MPARRRPVVRAARPVARAAFERAGNRVRAVPILPAGTAAAEDRQGQCRTADIERIGVSSGRRAKRQAIVGHARILHQRVGAGVEAGQRRDVDRAVERCRAVDHDEIIDAAADGAGRAEFVLEHRARLHVQRGHRQRPRTGAGRDDAAGADRDGAERAGAPENTAIARGGSTSERAVAEQKQAAIDRDVAPEPVGDEKRSAVDMRSAGEGRVVRQKVRRAGQHPDLVAAGVLDDKRRGKVVAGAGVIEYQRAPAIIPGISVPAAFAESDAVGQVQEARRHRVLAFGRADIDDAVAAAAARIANTADQYIVRRHRAAIGDGQHTFGHATDTNTESSVNQERRAGTRHRHHAGGSRSCIVEGVRADIDA